MQLLDDGLKRFARRLIPIGWWHVTALETCEHSPEGVGSIATVDALEKNLQVEIRLRPGSLMTIQTPVLNKIPEPIIDAGKTESQDQSDQGHHHEAIGASEREQEAIKWLSFIGFMSKQLPGGDFGQIMKDPTNRSNTWNRVRKSNVTR